MGLLTLSFNNICIFPVVRFYSLFNMTVYFLALYVMKLVYNRMKLWFLYFFVRFLWFHPQVRDIQHLNPCTNLLMLLSNDHKRNRLTRFRQVVFWIGWRQITVNTVSLCFGPNAFTILFLFHKIVEFINIRMGLSSLHLLKWICSLCV